MERNVKTFHQPQTSRHCMSEWLRRALSLSKNTPMPPRKCWHQVVLKTIKLNSALKSLCCMRRNDCTSPSPLRKNSQPKASLSNLILTFQPHSAVFLKQKGKLICYEFMCLFLLKTHWTWAILALHFLDFLILVSSHPWKELKYPPFTCHCCPKENYLILSMFQEHG